MKKVDKGKSKVKEFKVFVFVDEDGECIVMDVDYVEDDDDYGNEDERFGKKLFKVEKKKFKKCEKVKVCKVEEDNEDDDDMVVDVDEMDVEIVNIMMNKVLVKLEDFIYLNF